MRYLVPILFLIPFLFAFTHNNQRVIRVAIVDTGLNVEDVRFKDKLCPEVGEDFTGEGIADTVGHGTHVAGLIKEYAKDKNYCFIILKYYSENAPIWVNARQYLAAMDSLYKYKPDFVNISTDGSGPMATERSVISNLPDVKFFVAAGNDQRDLDKECSIFPACYARQLKNVTAVGNKNGSLSNFGNVVTLWIDGNEIDSTYPYALARSGRQKLSGTSMSTAIASGQYIYANY